MGIQHIRTNLLAVHKNLKAAAERSGRNEFDIRLVTVGKTRSIDEISAAISFGARDIGENRVSELVAKQSQIDAEVNWHFIGTLQRNKVKQVVGVVELIHSVDRYELGVEIDKRASKAGLVQSALVQVNVARESTKQGVDPKKLEKLIAELDKLRHISIEGIMTMAPFSREPESVRPVFAELKRLYDNLEDRWNLRWLSMGMTDDFVVAVEEGSNMVRVGRAIFTDGV